MRPSARASPTPPRCSSRSPCCAATAAATARSPSRRPGSIALPLPRGGARDRRRRCAGRAATRRCSPWASGPRSATRRRASGWPEHGYASTVDYLAAMCRLVRRRDRAAAPRQRRRAVRADELALLRAVVAVAGDDDRVAQPGRWPRHRGAPDKTPERRLATLEAAGRARASRSPPASWSGIGESRPDRIEALEAIAGVARPPRPRAGGDRPELPAQARHRDARCAALPGRRTTSTPSPWPG